MYQIMSYNNRTLVRWLVGLIGLLLLLYGVKAEIWSQPAYGDWYVVQAMEAADLGITNPVGLAFSPETNLLFTLSAPVDNGRVRDFLRLNLFGDPLTSNTLASDLASPLNTAYYAPTAGLVFLDIERGRVELVEVRIGSAGSIPSESQTVNRFNARAYGVREAQGITFDNAGRRLFVLDTGLSTPVLIRVTADRTHSFDGDTALQEGRLRRTRLSALKSQTLRGIAYNPQNGHLYTFSVDEQLIYELTIDGDIVSMLDVSELNLTNPQSMVFAASANNTDDPANMNLFMADSGLTKNGRINNPGQIIEIAFGSASKPAQLIPPSLVNIIDTSKAAWNPSSPDPAGIAYRPATSGLLISDSEVEEAHPDYQGYNVFESTTSGNLFATCSTDAFSDEPTGAAVNPTNGHVFFTDDNINAVFEVGLGLDGTYCTADDTVSSLDTTVFGSFDPEGLAYGTNRLFISDGVNQEIYVVDLGDDGVIGGSGADSDTLVSQFDTFGLGLRDPEGVVYNSANDTLFIVSTIGTDYFLVESTTGGTAVFYYDLEFLGSVPRSGLAYGPGSLNPGANMIYMSSRGVDNGTDPNENDGKVYEIELGTGNPPPVPSADFSGSPTSGDVPLMVDFTDLSTGAPTSWSWDFGDTFTSTDQSPSHTYVNTGTYTVSLTASSVSGSDTMTKTNYITVSFPITPTADFIGTPTTGNAPLQVNFTDQSAGNPTSWSWNFGDTINSTAENPSHIYADPGIYTVSLTVTNSIGSDMLSKTNLITVNVPPPPPSEAFYLTFYDNGTVGGINYADDDILYFDGTNWSIYFDGSDVGLGAEDIDGFQIIDADTILMSFTSDAVVDGINVQDHDIVEFTATSLGTSTAGTFSLYFDGEDVELVDPGEDIDALALLPDGRILISTLGSPVVTGVVEGRDEDVLAFIPTSLGENTSGTWEMYFDGSDTDLTNTSGVDLDAVSIAANGDIYLSTDVLATLGGINSEDEDVAYCSPSSLGVDTVCPFAPSLYFDGSAWGVDAAADVGGISFPPVITPPPDVLDIWLEGGWNMISSYVDPQDPDMSVVMSDVDPVMVLMKNGAGEVYWPEFSINQIGNWDILDGYQIYMLSPFTLTITGTQVIPDQTPIPLTSGWSLISYLRSSPQPIETALATISGELMVAKNNAGQVYWPEFSINQIGDMVPGQGYQVYLTVTSTLTYPANSLMNSVVPRIPYQTTPEPIHFTECAAGTGSNATVLIPAGSASLMDVPMEPGDELAVINTDGVCAGALVWQGATQAYALTIWGDDLLTPDVVEGLQVNEPLRFRVWHNKSNDETSIDLNISEGESSYKVNGLTIIESGVPTSVEIMSAWIEPANTVPNRLFPPLILMVISLFPRKKVSSHRTHGLKSSMNKRK